MRAISLRRSSVIIWLSVVGLCTVILMILLEIKAHLIQEKMDRTRYLVETAHSLIVAAHKDGQKRRLSTGESQKNALSSLKNLRYGENYYFWVNDGRPVMLMHPIKPDLVGRNLSAIRDSEGKLLFQEMGAIANELSEGFLTYYWPKPGQKEPVPKISFVKYFEPWDWIVGSGAYVEDVNRIFYKYVVIFSLFVVFLIFPIAYLFDRHLVIQAKNLD